MVGLCAIGAVSGLAALLVRFKEITPLFERNYQVPMRANTAMGLRVGSQVLLEGVPIGEVKTVDVRPSEALPVVLTLSLNDQHDVPATVRPTVSSGLLGGGSRIDLRLRDGASREPIDRANPVTLEGRFTSIPDQMEEILARINAGEGTMGRLLNDPKLYEDLREAAQRMALTLRELQSLVERVKKEGLELSF